MESARQQPRFNLHELTVDVSDDKVLLFDGELLGVVLGQVDIPVQVALASGLDDGGADGIRPTAIPHALVRRDELLELLQSLVQSSVFGRWGQVRDGVRV